MRAVIFAIALAACVSAASIKWTGYANNNQWITPTNWYPDQVPGPNDDVEINSGVVQVTIATGVNSLVMGESLLGTANITFFNTFFVGQGGVKVYQNGNIFIMSGPNLVSGQFTIGGGLYFNNGLIGGEWTITNTGAAHLTNPAQKAFSGCQFITQGPLDLSGTILLNQSSVIQISGTAAITGNTNIQNGDQSSVNFDGSAGTVTFNGGTLQLQAPTNFGAFTIQSGNVTIFDNVQFAQTLVIPKSTYVQTVGVAAVDLSQSGLGGSGVFSAFGASLKLGNMSFTSGTLNLGAGNNTFTSAAQVGLLTLDGGNTILKGAVTATFLNVMNGILTGSSALTFNGAYIASGGFVLNTGLTLNGTSNVLGDTTIAFQTSGQITVPAGSTLNAAKHFVLTGPPATPGIVNNGQIVVSHITVVQNIPVAGTGSFSLSNSLSINSISFTQSTVALSSGGSFRGADSTLTLGSVTGSPVVKATFGSYKTQCPAKCLNVQTPTMPTSRFSFTL